MRRIAAGLIGTFLAVAVAASATAQGRHDERPHGVPKASPPSAQSPSDPSDNGIPLKDGGKLVIRADGTTYHLDAAGKRVRMRDGVIMEAADGTRYMMKNDAVWRAITEKGTLHPTHQ